MADTFAKELETLLNRYNQEHGSNTPDFILAAYLMDCLLAWNQAVRHREQWYGRGATVLVTHVPPQP